MLVNGSVASRQAAGAVLRGAMCRICSGAACTAGAGRTGRPAQIHVWIIQVSNGNSLFEVIIGMHSEVSLFPPCILINIAFRLVFYHPVTQYYDVLLQLLSVSLHFCSPK